MKAIHIVGIAVWCAGLFALPSLYVRKSKQPGPRTLTRLHRFTRFAFINVTSPAAFIAIATGIVLIFLSEAFTAWMVLKLAAVGLLVMVHIWSSYTVIHIFEPGRRFARWQQAVMVGATLVAVSAVLLLVLWKPDGELDALLEWVPPVPFTLPLKS